MEVRRLTRMRQSNLLVLSMRLAETPCGPLYKRHISPERELAALAASTTD